MREQFPHYIEFRQVYKTFDYPVLVDCNFHVSPGETLAIIGRSGVGKSVSLGHVMGFIKPDAGRVIVATNGYTPEGLIPGLAGRNVPVISNIVTTRPLSDAELAAQRWQRDAALFSVAAKAREARAARAWRPPSASRWRRATWRA